MLAGVAPNPDADRNSQVFDYEYIFLTHSRDTVSTSGAFAITACRVRRVNHAPRGCKYLNKGIASIQMRN